MARIVFQFKNGMHDALEGSSCLLKIGDVVRNPLSCYGSDSYEIISYLGKGGFAECFSASSSRRREDVAIKVVDKRKTKDPNNLKMHREIRLHSQANHPNIVRLYSSFETEQCIYLILELCGKKNLLSTINYAHAVHGSMLESECRHYTKGLLAAVSYLLTCGVLHRDLKPGNIFIGKNGQVKLGDFGLAVRLEDVNPNSVSGTPNYLAPEILEKRGHSEKSEIFSIGCILFCMMTGRPPFESDSIENTYKRIGAASYIMPEKVRDRMPHAVQVVQRCLLLDPVQRPSFEMLSQCDWIRQTSSSLYPQPPANVAIQRRHPSHCKTSLVDSPMSRARSVGNILCSDINGNVSVALSKSRPKSVTSRLEMISIADRTDRSRSSRKSMTGSHDSGFGSESDMSLRPLIAERVCRILGDIRAVIAGSHILVPSDMPEVFVSKWVDYTNRRGFACKLTDGSVTVKFVEGTCISWQDRGSSVLYAVSPFSSPRVIPLAEFSSPSEVEHIETTKQYRQYMDNELAGDSHIARSPLPIRSVRDSPYLVFNRLTAEHLIMVLSDGTIQVNLLRQKVKLILFNDISMCARGVAVISRNHAPMAFRIMSTPRAPYEHWPSYLKMGSGDTYSMYPYLSDVSRVITSECDFIYSAKKPVQCTEL